jgi:hypothetical protein
MNYLNGPKQIIIPNEKSIEGFEVIKQKQNKLTG